MQIYVLVLGFVLLFVRHFPDVWIAHRHGAVTDPVDSPELE